jgi:SAM-dependent methyltransferase
MNEEHAKLCSSREWIEELATDVLEPLTSGIDFGGAVLELGPGPGAATEWLVDHVGKLTCLESDPDAAASLAERFGGRGVDVITGDAAEMDLRDESFDTVCLFTMLHHVPTNRAQNALLSESLRVLRAGGVLVGADSLASVGLHHFHEHDTYNPVEPASFLTRLQTIGFRQITLIVGDDLRFVAHKATSDADEEDDCSS